MPPAPKSTDELNPRAGDIAIVDYNALLPIMQKASDNLTKAAVAGSQAQQLYNLSRARQLQTRITLLGVGYPEDRYGTLQLTR